MSDIKETIKLSFEEAYRISRDALLKYGASDAQANAVASSVTMAERNGAASHGLFRIPGYVATLKSGKVKGDAQVETMPQANAILKIDGHGGFAPLAHEVAFTPLCEMARKNGIAVGAFHNIHHFSALWIETERFAKAGLIAMAMTAYMPVMVHPGGKKPIYGTNPFSFAFPRHNEPPLVLDFATSQKARGEVMIAAREGHAVEDGVGVDKAGQPTNDPNEILKGAMLPFGGYKGAGLALMIELLVGPLLHQPTSLEAGLEDNKDGGPPRGGEFVIIIDPNAFGHGDGFIQQAESLFNEILQDEGTRLPGQGRAIKRTRIETEASVTIPRPLYDKITGA